MCTEMQACDKHALDLRTSAHGPQPLSAPSSLRVCFRSWHLADTYSQPPTPRGRPWQFCPSMVLCTHAAVHAVSSATQALFCPPEKRQILFQPKKCSLPCAELSPAPATPSPRASQRERPPGICSSLRLAGTQGQSDSWRGVRKNQELKGKSTKCFPPPPGVHRPVYSGLQTRQCTHFQAVLPQCLSLKTPPSLTVGGLLLPFQLSCSDATSTPTTPTSWPLLCRPVSFSS